MKKKGSKSDIICHRNKAILSIYKSMKRTCMYKNMYEICKAMSVLPVQRYYISEAMAQIRWSEYQRTGTINVCDKYKKRLYIALMKDCSRIKIQEGGCDRAVTRAALEMQSPCLGIGPFRILAILKENGMK